MASQPIDQGAILRSGAALVPNLAEQIAQRDQLAIQRQQVANQTAGVQRQIAEDARDQATAQSYAADLTAIGQLPSKDQPAALIALMRKYPKQSEALKRSYDAQDETVKAANFQEASEIYSLLQNGATDRAAERLRRRIAADKAAGVDTEDDEAILAGLESGDPAQERQAIAQIGWQLSTVAGPDKFASTYGALNPSNEFERTLDTIAQRYGQEAADNYARNRYDPFIESNNRYGTTFYRSSDLGGGGAPSQGQGENVSGGKGRPVADAGSIAKGLFPDIEVTQVRRDPNSALGKANPDSWHNRSGAAVDVRPIPGMTFRDYVKRYRDAGYQILEARNEVGKGRSPHATGDHWHIVLGGGPQSGPARVTSKAQYDKLPSGTVFIAPDGSQRRKP